MRYREEVIRQWSLPKVKEGKLWQDETVQEEAKLLLEELYPDEKQRKAMENGLERMLGGNEILQAQVETLLAGWQGALDTRIAEISKACSEEINKNPPKTARDAAQARVNYIEKFQQSFSEGDKSLSKWLQGDSQERRDLINQFDNLQKEAEQSMESLKTAQIELIKAGIDIKQAEIELDTSKKKAKIAGIGRIKANLDLERASLMVQVSHLAGLKAGKEEEAKEISAKASEQKQKAAEQIVFVMEGELLAAKARQKGAENRGVAARRIRSSLSLPVFSFSFAENAAAFAREEHAEALDEAFRAIRELLRHVRTAGVSLGTPDLQHLDSIRPSGGANLWSKAIIDYKGSYYSAIRLLIFSA